MTTATIPVSPRVARVGQGSWSPVPQDTNALAEQLLNQFFVTWLGALESNESAFKRYVYDNPNMSDADLRQHRILLHNELQCAEQLALGYELFARQNDRLEEYADKIKLIDQKRDEIVKVFLSWHGPVEMQDDVPESFKQAMCEVEAGELEDDTDI